jgi:hypothetical protein
MTYKIPANSSPERLSYWIQSERLNMEGDRFEHGLITIHIRHVHAENMAAILAGTVDNAAGYGTRESAERVGRTAAAAIRNGVTHAYSTTFGGPDVSLRFQQYNEATYCGSPRVEIGGDGDYRAAARGVEFLEWLARKADRAAFTGSADTARAVHSVLANPSRVVATLDRIGAVRLMPWAKRRALIGESGGFWICDADRVPFATDTVVSNELAA